MECIRGFRWCGCFWGALHRLGVMKLRGGDARIAPLIAGSEHRGNATEVLKNIIVAGGYFALVAAGGGAVSLCGGAAPGILSRLP